MTTASETYAATLSVMSGTTLVVTANGASATVDSSLKTHAHTLTLRLTAGSPPSPPAWAKVAGLLGGLSPLSYSVALLSPATLSGSGTAVQVTAAAGSGPIAAALTSGGTLVVTLGAAGSPAPTPAWADVAAILETLAGVTFGADITCVD